jgi:Flp pilus assembly pilin Flp
MAKDARSRRSGQTAIEYLLVTISLLLVFVMMYKALQYALRNQFTRGGLVIVRMYTETPL